MYKEKAFRELNHIGSYHINDVAGHLQTEINRLGAQVNLFWNKELKHYIEYGLTDGMKVAELGSGPGFLTENLLKVFPRIQITGVEIDKNLVDYSTKRLNQIKPGTCTFINASIMDTGLPENKYDFAIIRLLLEHLPEPIRAAREVHRILKPGGKAVFVDNDFEMHLMTNPSIPELRDLYQAYCQARCAEGGNPRIGRELPVILKKSGFANIDFEVIVAHNEIVGDDIFFKAQGVGIPTKLVQDGYISSKLMGQISVQWRNVVKNQDHAMIRQLYLGFGEKAN